MTERRRPKIQLGRRKSDVPIKALEQFKLDISKLMDSKFLEQKNENVVTIKGTVNGKIDKIDKKLDDYIISDTKWKLEQETYRKESTDPVVKTYNQTFDFFKVAKVLIGGLILIGLGITAWASIKNHLL